MKIAIAGGGIAGLAAALRLREQVPAAEIVVFEESSRPGGMVRTGQITAVDGGTMPFDFGAENFLARDPATGGDSAAVRLARHLGLGADLVHPDQVPPALAVDGALRPVPRGTLMGVPGDLDALGDVAKPAVDLDRDEGRPLLAPGQDVAVGELVRARFGDQVVERLVDPLLGGIYAGSADHLSLATTMPGLAAAAAKEHTLVAAVRAATSASAAHRPGPGAPVFATVAGGVRRLVQAMAAQAQAQVQVNTAVRALRRTGSGWALTVGLPSGLETVEADAVVLAVPAAAAAKLLATEHPDAATDVGALEYASIALVTLVLPKVDLPELSGILVPAGQGFDVKAATLFTRKWPHLRRPDGTVVVRASVGRYGDHNALHRADSDLIQHVRSELSTLLDAWLPAHVDCAVWRWGGALPQYAPGHLDRVGRARGILRADSPSLALAGAAYDGVGIPVCIRSGETAADQITAALG